MAVSISSDRRVIRFQVSSSFLYHLSCRRLALPPQARCSLFVAAGPFPVIFLHRRGCVCNFLTRTLTFACTPDPYPKCELRYQRAVNDGQLSPSTRNLWQTRTSGRRIIQARSRSRVKLKFTFGHTNQPNWCTFAPNGHLSHADSFYILREKAIRLGLSLESFPIVSTGIPIEYDGCRCELPSSPPLIEIGSQQSDFSIVYRLFVTTNPLCFATGLPIIIRFLFGGVGVSSWPPPPLVAVSHQPRRWLTCGHLLGILADL